MGFHVDVVHVPGCVVPVIGQVHAVLARSRVRFPALLRAKPDLVLPDQVADAELTAVIDQESGDAVASLDAASAVVAGNHHIHGPSRAVPYRAWTNGSERRVVSAEQPPDGVHDPLGVRAHALDLGGWLANRKVLGTDVTGAFGRSDFGPP